MLLMSVHLQALDELVASEAAGHATHAIAEEAVQAFRVLELQGLALPQTGLSYRLTYEGREAIRLLEAMRQDDVLPAYREKDPGWRFLGSEILTAMDAAARVGGHIGPAAEMLLQARGFAEPVDEREGGARGLRLNTHGAAWLAFAHRLQPRLEITSDLAAALLAMPMGYVHRRSEGVSPSALAALEAMDLVAWSVPDGEYSALTALGLAVYDALCAGSYPATDAVLDDAIVHELEQIARRGAADFSPERLAELQRLGYVTSAGAVSSAGEAALRARGLMQAEAVLMPPTFAITRYEVEVLRAVQELGNVADGAAQGSIAPTRMDLHRVLVDRLEEHYQDFVGEYGSTVHDELARKRQAQALQQTLHEHQREFGDPADLEAQLVNLESFALVRAEWASEIAELTFHLTVDGRHVLEEQGARPRDITALAVKAITSIGAAGRFGAPATAWIEQAHSEGLLGPHGISQAGLLYAELARRRLKWTALSRLESEILLSLPQTAQDVLGSHAHHPGPTEHELERRRAWALDKLDARGFVDQLADRQVLATVCGRLVTRAVSGALQLTFPVTPALLRLLTAVEHLGQTLYIQEERPHEAPEQWEALARLAELEPDPLREAVHIAKLGRYLGDAGLTEASHQLLDALGNGNLSEE